MGKISRNQSFYPNKASKYIYTIIEILNTWVIIELLETVRGALTSHWNCNTHAVKNPAKVLQSLK